MIALLLAAVPVWLDFPQDPPAAAPAAVAQPQIEWQRSLADALAVQQASGRPLLLCVNMDGEVFCERFAGETYRDPAFVATTRGHVCLIASPDRHNPFDYDAEGNRIECPRFGGVTCGEHIAVEPGLFERWFGGRRAAPRHVCVSPGGEILCDHILENSMQPAIDSVRRHGVPGADRPLPATAAGLLQRRDAAARAAIEATFRSADPAARLVLLEAAAQAGSEPFDLLRMALRSDDPRQFAAAVQALAATATADAVIDVADALARTDDTGQRERLLAALARVGATDQAAAALHARLVAVAGDCALANQEPWRTVAQQAVPEVTAPERGALEERIDALERELKARPDDTATRLELAQQLLALGDLLAESGDRNATLYFEDARRAADRVRSPGVQGLAGCVAAVATWQLGQREVARERARAAVAALTVTGDAAAAGSDVAGRALAVLANAAAAAVYAAYEVDPMDPAAAALTEAARAFAALSSHPSRTEQHLLDRAALLEFAGARSQARAVLRGAVHRFPASPAVHERFRHRVLLDLGTDGLLAAYREIATSEAGAAAEWFAGYAALVAAEQNVRDRRAPRARAAYDLAVERFLRSAELEAGYADSAHHFAVLALAGRALLRHEAGDGEGAVQDLVRARELRPASMESADGLGRKPAGILRRVARELREQGKAALTERLGGAAGG